MVGIVAGEAVAQLRVVAVHDNPGEDTEHVDAYRNEIRDAQGILLIPIDHTAYCNDAGNDDDDDQFHVHPRHDELDLSCN